MSFRMQILNTLYIQTQGSYVHLHEKNLRVEQEGQTVLQLPLHHLEGLVVFGNVLLSPPLIHNFAAEGRSIVWFSQSGKYLARLQGETSGNVLLRKAQYDAHNDLEKKTHLARKFVIGKIKNSRHILLRGGRDYKSSTKEDGKLLLNNSLRELEILLKDLQKNSYNIEVIRGIEGRAATVYFSAVDYLIRNNTETFRWQGRNRRPPRDPLNALLSFAYSLLLNECVSACEGVGLDPQIGFLHTLRPGRPALALDLCEEFRSVLGDRLVLTLINRRQIKPEDFEIRPGGAVSLKEEARRVFLSEYQTRKAETIQHPVLKQNVPVGLLPHVQARLLARFLRGDTEDYIPYSAK